jgi:hypothetical protein
MRRRLNVTSHRSRRGAALVDVIIGSMLLAMGLAVVISLSARSLRTQTDGEKQMIASWIADELLTMVLVEGPVNYPKLHDTRGRLEYPFDEFEYEVTLEDQGLGLPFRVTATVRWDGAAVTRHVQVQTLIADRGHQAYQERSPLDMVDRINRWWELHEKR